MWSHSTAVFLLKGSFLPFTKLLDATFYFLFQASAGINIIFFADGKANRCARNYVSTFMDTV